MSSIYQKSVTSDKMRDMISGAQSAPGPVPVETLLQELGEPSGYDDTQYRWGNKSSLLVDIEGGMAVAWHSFETGESGRDLQQLIDNKEKYVSATIPFSGALEKRDKPDRWSAAEAVEGFWETADPVRVDGDSAGAYLRARGIDPDIDAALVRQGPHRSNKSARAFPALMIPLRDERGEVTAVQAIRCPGGAKLEHVAKVTHGAARGSVFSLPGSGATVLCEGPEDALSIWQATGHPVMATCGKGNLPKAPVGGLDVILWLDNDMTVEEIEDVVDRLPARSISGIMVDGHDANSLLLAEGAGAVRSALEGAVPMTPPKPDPSEFKKINASEIITRTLPPMPWIVPGVIPARRVGSLAGASNVGKTYYVAALAVALSMGQTELLGLPEMEKAVPVLIVTNEEDVDDVEFRVKAPSIYYNAQGTNPADIYVRGNDDGMFTLASKDDNNNLKVDHNRVNRLIEVVKDAGIKVIIMDPYITLAMGAEENSNDTHPILTDAFNRICHEGDCSIMHVHHTKKSDGKTKDYDGYSGDRDAWRGGGSIFSALHFGFTLANWMPKGDQDRKDWKAKFNEYNLGRFVEVAHAKTKRSKKLPPIIYELIDQPMPEEMENPLPVFRVVTRDQAIQALHAATGADMRPGIVAQGLLKAFGEGQVRGLSKIHEKMHGQPGWPDTEQADANKQSFKDVLEPLVDGIEVDGYVVSIEPPSTRGKSWTLKIGAESEV